MSSPVSAQSPQDTVRALAKELLALAETYEPSAKGAWGIESPVVTKAKAIIAAAQSPIEHAIGMVVSGMEAAVLRDLIYLKAIDSLPESGSISLAELSKVTKSDPALLRRLFRPFVGNGLIRQDSPDTYAHTPLSLAYRANEMSGVLFTVCADDGIDILTRLPQYLESKRTGPESPYAEPGSLRDNLRYNPWNWRWGEEGRSNYEILAEDPVRMARLHLLLGSIAHLNPFVGFYDFSKLALPLPTTEASSTPGGADGEPPRAVFVDIGGGHGPAIAHMLAAHPEIHPRQCVLQDLEPVIRDVEAGAANAQSLPAGVRKQAHDYFAPQPVRGARAYHLRAVAHNLSDQNLLRVLGAIKPVMAADSKLLIADNVIPDRGVKGLSGFMDLLMMSIGGKERTEAEFREVLGNAGLKVDAIHRAEGERNYAMVEASLY